MVWTLPRSLSLLRRFPGPNVPIIVSRGHSDWPAMRVLKRLGGSRSDCSVFPNALPPHLVGLLLDRRSLVDLTCSLLGYTCLFGRGLFSLLLLALRFFPSPLFSPRSPFRFCFIQHREVPVQDDIRIPKPCLAL